MEFGSAVPRPFIDGDWVGDTLVDTAAAFADFDPSTGEVIAQVPAPRIECATLAMDAASRAQPAWARLQASDRRGRLLRLADAIEQRRSRFVALIRAETGILAGRATEEVNHAIELLHETVELPEQQTQIIEQSGLAPGRVERAPYGVVVWIMSWNSPLAALCKIAGPLVAGNTMVLKASHNAPLCASLFAEAVAEAGFPDGAVNVLWDARGELVPSLVTDTRLGKCAFTGRPETAGLIVRAMSERQLRPTFMETGGGGIQVVREDAHLDTILPHLLWGALSLSGQICCAGTKILVHRSLLEPLVEEFAGRLLSMKIGSAHADDTHLGPMISSVEVDRMESLARQAEAFGTMIVPLQFDIPECGFFAAPTVAISPNCDGPYFSREIFGPSVVFAPYTDDQSLVRKLHGLRTGLTLSLYTQSEQWLEKNKAHLDFGTIWCNGHYQSSARLPFGGMKDSGYGRERGTEGLREFSQCRVIVSPPCY